MQEIPCKSCSQLPFTPVEVLCCKEIYCWECVIHTKTCFCGSTMDPANCSPRPDIQEYLDEIVGCANSGCGYTCPRIVMKQHGDICPNREIKCPAAGCKEQVQFSLLNEHQKSCPFSDISCTFCGQFFPPSRITDHLEHCDHRPLDCSCGETFTGHTYRDHSRTCLYVEVSCPLNSCGFKCLRLNMPNHMSQQGEAHIQLLETQLLQQSAEIETLRYQSRANAITRPYWNLPGFVQESFQQMNRESLVGFILFLIFLTLVPMKFLILRSFFFGGISYGIWLKIAHPAMIKARSEDKLGSILLTLGAFCITSFLVWKWLALV